jgi:pilus assembly protein CpaC
LAPFVSVRIFSTKNQLVFVNRIAIQFRNLFVLRSACAVVFLAVFLASFASPAFAQMLARPPIYDKAEQLEEPAQIAISKEQNLIREIIEPELLLRVEPLQSKIIRTNFPIVRTAISDPRVVDVQAFGSNELEIIGKQVGEATLTFWFEEPGKGVTVLRYFVQVIRSQQEHRRREARYREIQSRINELFPNSQVFLFPIEDKLIVRGQARDSKEAAEILQLLGEQFGGRGRGRGNGGFGGGNGGFGQSNRSGNVLGDYNFVNTVDSQQTTGNNFPGSGAGPNGSDSDRRRLGLDVSATDIINQLKVTGEQQVMLKVRVAELVRNSDRGAGADLSVMLDRFQLSHLLSGGGNVTAILEDPDVSFFLRAIGTHGYGKILAEPTLVTLNGRSASFLAGGEFAVPTTVGIGGVGAASTQFRGFGTELQFTPTILDKDLVRLQVAPSFSTLNSDATVGGIPGLSRRSIQTTVELREGQWLAIAGLIQDEQGGQRTRLPFVGDLPILGGFFGTQSTARSETELVVLVSPELIHPLEPEQVPLILPGMEVTDPTDDDFFLRHQTEGYRGHDHRSTHAPERQAHIAGYKSDAFHNQINHRLKRQMKVQEAYIVGESGFSR